MTPWGKIRTGSRRAQWTAYTASPNPPGGFSATPPSGGPSLTETFQFHASDVNGYFYIQAMEVVINSSANAAGACAFIYYPYSGVVDVINDTNTGYVTPELYPGTAGSMTNNSQCTVDVSVSQTPPSGNDLYLSAAITFSTSFEGNQTVYIEALDRAYTLTNLSTAGSWNVNIAPPTNVSVTPTGETSPSQLFTAVVSSQGGYQYINSVYLDVNWSMQDFGGCQVWYSQGSSTLNLLADTQYSWTPAKMSAPGAFLENARCYIDVQNSSVSGNGANLTINIMFKFKPTFVGPQTIYMKAVDTANQYSNQQPMAAWTGFVAVPGSPNFSVSPSFGGPGMSQTFSFQVSDVNGAYYIPYMQFLINTSTTQAGACLVDYWQYTNTVDVIDDNGYSDVSPPLNPPSAGKASNSQCSVDAAASSYSISTNGNDLYLNLAITFSSGFTGTKYIYMLAEDRTGTYTTWGQPVGQFTVGTVTGTGFIQGVKVNPSLAQFDPGATITVGGMQFGPGTNPYSTGFIAAGNYTVTSSVPAGYSVAYSVCYSCIDHTAAGGHPFVAGNSVNVNLSTGGYVDLWWQYSGPDFTITLSDNGSNLNPLFLSQGGGAFVDVAVGSLGGLANPIVLSLSGIPGGWTAYFTPSATIPAGGGVTALGLEAPTYATPGQYPVTITGQSGSIVHTASFTIQVTGTAAGPYFTLSASPSSQNVAAGNSVSFTVYVGSVGGFSGTVGNFTVSGLAGIGSSISPGAVAGSGTVTLNVFPSIGTASGSYPFTINASSGSLVASIGATLIVGAAARPSFTLTAAPSPVTVAPGMSGQYLISVTPQNGFSSAVSNFIASGLPANAYASFSPTTVTGQGSTRMTVTTSGVSSGLFQFTVLATGGNLSVTTQCTLSIPTQTGLSVPSVLHAINYSPRGHSYWRMLYDWDAYNLRPTITTDLANLKQAGFNVIHLYVWDRPALTNFAPGEPAGFCSDPAPPGL